MSAETELHALLKADAGVRGALGAADVAAAARRISADRAEQDAGKPFVVFVRTATEDFEGLDGTVFDSKVTLELQCWGDKRTAVDALADACQTAIRGADQAVLGRTSGFDPELDMEATVLTVEWWPA